MKSKNIVPYGTKYNYSPMNVMQAEWRAAMNKLNSDWSRVRLSNEDIETIIKITAKLP